MKRNGYMATYRRQQKQWEKDQRAAWARQTAELWKIQKSREPQFKFNFEKGENDEGTKTT